MEEKRRYNYAFYEIFSSEFKRCQNLSTRAVSRMLMDFADIPSVKQEQLEATMDKIVTNEIMPVLANNGITESMACQLHVILKGDLIAQKYLFPGGRELVFNIIRNEKGKYQIIYRLDGKKFRAAS